MKTKRVTCVISVTERCLHGFTTQNDTHNRNCNEMNRSLDALLQPNQNSQQSVSAGTSSNKSTGENQSIEKSEPQTNTQQSQTVIGPLASLITHHVTAAPRDQLNMLFEKAIHKTATFFSYFEHPE